MDEVTNEIINVLQKEPLKAQEIILRLKGKFKSEDIVNSLNKAVSTKKINLNFLKGLYFY